MAGYSLRHPFFFLRRSIFFLIVLSMFSYALPYHDIRCGIGISLPEGVIKSSPFKENVCRQTPLEKDPVVVIERIEGLDRLIDRLSRSKNRALLRLPFIKKLLRDPDFNTYTLTILLHIKIPEYQETIEQDERDLLDEISERIGKKRFRQIYGEGYLSSIIRGREFIGIVHIRTKSMRDYRKTESQIRQALASWQKDGKLGKVLKKISPDHPIDIINYISGDCNITPAIDVNTLMENIKSFLQAHCLSADILDFEAKPYPFIKSASLKKREQREAKIVDDFLKCKTKINSLLYMKKHPEEFDHIPQLETIDHLHASILSFENRIQKGYIDTNRSTKPLKKCLEFRDNAQRYSSQIPMNAIALPERSFSFILSAHHDLFRLVDLRKKLEYRYDVSLNITNHGKVLILNEIHTLYFNGKEIFLRKNAHILLDTYVNYPKLRFKHIDSIQFGSISFSFNYDRFSQNLEKFGSGLIEKGNCGYTTVDSNGTLKIVCKEIRFKPVSISFEHDEKNGDIDREKLKEIKKEDVEILLNRRRPTFPHQ